MRVVPLPPGTRTGRGVLAANCSARPAKPGRRAGGDRTPSWPSRTRPRSPRSCRRRRRPGCVDRRLGVADGFLFAAGVARKRAAAPLPRRYQDIKALRRQHTGRRRVDRGEKDALYATREHGDRAAARPDGWDRRRGRRSMGDGRRRHRLHGLDHRRQAGLTAGCRSNRRKPPASAATERGASDTEPARVGKEAENQCPGRPFPRRPLYLPFDLRPGGGHKLVVLDPGRDMRSEQPMHDRQLSIWAVTGPGSGAPSRACAIRWMRPRGESVSCPHRAYVGHAGRQKPQCTQSSISSRGGGRCSSRRHQIPPTKRPGARRRSGSNSCLTLRISSRPGTGPRCPGPA